MSAWTRGGGLSLVVPRVVLITDPAFGDDRIVRCVQAAAHALPEGAFGVQLRDKRRAQSSLRVFASRLRLVTRRARAWLFINGDAQLARDVGADGVHLGREAGTVQSARGLSGERTIISVAAHTDDDVRRALENGADAALVSPVFSTRSPSRFADVTEAKKPRGLAAIRAARSIAGSRLLLYALGGVGVDCARDCAEAGADGAAVIRALLEAADPARVARCLYDTWMRC